jgi:hypothetical protein
MAVVKVNSKMRSNHKDFLRSGSLVQRKFHIFKAGEKDTHHYMKRRNFIFSAAAGIGAVGSAAYYFTRDVEFDIVLARPESLAPLWDAQAIHAIGNQYRANTPGETSTRSLVNILNATLPERKGSIASRLEESITNDFAAGKTVLVDGWILSVTEARQCALASTIQPE